MATGLSLDLRDIRPHDRDFLPMQRSIRSLVRAKKRPLNACKVGPPDRRRARRAANRIAKASRRANRR